MCQKVSHEQSQLVAIRLTQVSLGVELLRLHIPMINPKGNGRVLQIFDPADGHEVYRNEGKEGCWWWW